MEDCTGGQEYSQSFHYNWCMYLLNQFMEDCTVAHMQNQPFHYSWLLVLMDFVMWKEPKYTQLLSVRSDCRGVRYANLWATVNLERQRINNQVFYTYYQQLYAMMENNPRITKEVTDMYIKRIRFMVDIHRIYIKPHEVKGTDWHTGAYRMEQEDVEQIVKEWSEDWKNSTVDVSDSDEEKGNEKGKEKIG